MPDEGKYSGRAIMPSRNQKRSGAIAWERFVPAALLALAAFRMASGLCSFGYCGRKNESASGGQRRSKSTLLYRPNGPTMRQCVIIAEECAAWSRSTFAPSVAAATRASLRLNVQPLLREAPNFTRRRTELKAQVLLACCNTRLDASS